MSRKKITAVVIAKNEAKMLAACLNTLHWADRILVIDCASTDETVSIAEKAGADVIHFESPSFAQIRNKALDNIETDYLFYVDADERVTPALAKEILVHLENDDCPGMSMKRENICYGQKFEHGNWENDWVLRVFKQQELEGWQGEIHESPIFKGEICYLKQKLIHLTHRSTQDNLFKSANWTIKEAKLLAKSADTKAVTFKTILRKGVMEFYRRAFKYQGKKDGLAGLIEALVQGINRMLVYIQVWELQQKPQLSEKYDQVEAEIKKTWQKEAKNIKA